jgi:predicted MFS family arabinose efflux permease
MNLASSERTGAWFSATFDSLRLPPYRILWIGSLIAFIGFMMSTTAQSVVAHDLTGSNRAVGTVMFGQGLAMLALAPFGGALADRLSKRLVLLVCQTTIGLTMLATAILIATGEITVLFLALGSFIMGTMFSFLAPTRQAFIGEVVPTEMRANAVALTQVAQNASRVVGPFLAGALLALSFVGSSGTYFVMAAMFVIVVATLARLPASTPRDSGSRGLFADISAGVQYVSHEPQLLQLVIGFFAIVLVGFTYMTVLPAFILDELGRGKAELGIVTGIAAAGGLVVSLALTSVVGTPRAGTALTLSTLAFGITLILTGLAPTFLLVCLTMLLVGGAVSGFQTLNMAIAMHLTEPAFYGRVMSLLMLAWSGNGLVALPVGALADEIGERATFIVMGAAVCAVLAVLQLWAMRTDHRPEARVRPVQPAEPTTRAGGRPA